MINNYFHSESYRGDSVISIVYHPPEIKPGAIVTIVKPWKGHLCAVQLPDGMIHTWFASFELRPINYAANFNSDPVPGSLAQIISTVGHPQHIKLGTIVKIIRCFPITFYDVTLSDGKYHRWLSEFEVAKPV